MTNVLIDVRERDEFAVEHVEHSINIPLSVFSATAPGVLNQLKDRPVTFMCRSGARATHAMEMAKSLGYNDVHTYQVYEGGIMAWKSNGGQVIKAEKGGLPLIRQTQLMIGSMALVFALLALFIHPGFSYLSLGVGFGLFYAGMSGRCAVASMLAKAPWNRASSSDSYRPVLGEQSR